MTDPKGLIYIKTNVFLYLVECNVVPINIFTLELYLNIVIRNGRTSVSYHYGLKIISEIESNV